MPQSQTSLDGANGRLKVALVDLDGQPVPAWVLETLEREHIELAIRDCKTTAELTECASEAEVVWLFGGSRILQGGNLDAVPNCWAILRTGSGTDNIPIEEATRRGIVVANTPAAFSDAVSDHVIALLFAVVRRIVMLDRTTRLGQWDPSQSRPLASVCGGTLGLVGFGHIARELVTKLSGFELNVLACDPFVAADVIAAQGVSPATLKEILSTSDFVSLHCPLTPDTRHLIGEEQLRLMKRTAILINTSRGAVIDEQALVRALSEGWLTAAGLDVFEEEPPSASNPLFKLDNVVLTPHSAGLSAQGTDLRWQLSIETLIALAQGRWPPSCVNRHVQARKQLT